MINTADEREEVKGAILDDPERSEILPRNIIHQYNLQNNNNNNKNLRKTCFKTSLNAELQEGDGGNLKNRFRNVTVNSKLKTVKWKQHTKRNYFRISQLYGGAFCPLTSRDFYVHSQGIEILHAAYMCSIYVKQLELNGKQLKISLENLKHIQWKFLWELILCIIIILNHKLKFSKNIYLF